MWNGKRFKTLRERAGLTQTDLAKALKLSRSAIAMYERNDRAPSYETLETISDYFNCDIAYLLGEQEEVNRYKAAFGKEGSSVRIPVYGRVAAGIPIEAITEIEDFEEIDTAMAATGDFMALKIHGDSMEPKMSDGDVIIIRKQDDCETGDIAVVMVNGSDATCKRIKKTTEGIYLISTNPLYDPMFFTNKQISSLPVRILGKVVELRAKFK